MICILGQDKKDKHTVFSVDIEDNKCIIRMYEPIENGALKCIKEGRLTGNAIIVNKVGM